MLREEALEILGFQKGDNPTRAEISRAQSEKIIALKGLDEAEKSEKLSELIDAYTTLLDIEQKAPTVPETKALFQKKPSRSWLPWFSLAAIFTLTLLFTFFYAYRFMPLYFGLSKVMSALLVTSFVAGGAVLTLGVMALALGITNHIATRKYDLLLSKNASLNLSDESVRALQKGLEGIAWAPYLKSFQFLETYLNPLAFRAGLRYAQKEDLGKIVDINAQAKVRYGK